MRKVAVEQAVGMVLGHDITRIIPGQEKVRAFKRGQIIQVSDLEVLKNLGKEHIFVWEEDDEANLVHEDEAARRLAEAACGAGISFGQPNQGKVELKADYDGLLKIDLERQNQLNDLEDVILASLHTNRAVKKEQILAGTRITPLAIPKAKMLEAEAICRSQSEPLIQVKPYQPRWVALVTTGSEVFSGRIKDGSQALIKSKINPFGGRFLGQSIVPDQTEVIAKEIRRYLAEGAEMVFVSGGMSVDPDDVTPSAIRSVAAEVVFYGAPVLPGSMFMLAYQGKVPICGLPGCIMFNKQTILDLLLPRLFAGEHIKRREVMTLGQGGLCQNCPVCHYPDCAFGKA
ncbi:MAG: molybdopterin-binding protein [Clostridia bacterium]|nr:molybdopterin-binding protein [Clostridia bacterium]